MSNSISISTSIAPIPSSSPFHVVDGILSAEEIQKYNFDLQLLNELKAEKENLIKRFTEAITELRNNEHLFIENSKLGEEGLSVSVAYEANDPNNIQNQQNQEKEKAIFGLIPYCSASEQLQKSFEESLYNINQNISNLQFTLDNIAREYKQKQLLKQQQQQNNINNNKHYIIQQQLNEIENNCPDSFKQQFHSYKILLYSDREERELSLLRQYKQNEQERLGGMIQKVELLTVENQHFQQQINNKENEIKQKNIEIEKLKESHESLTIVYTEVERRREEIAREYLELVQEREKLIHDHNTEKVELEQKVVELQNQITNLTIHNSVITESALSSNPIESTSQSIIHEQLKRQRDHAKEELQTYKEQNLQYQTTIDELRNELRKFKSEFDDRVREEIRKEKAKKLTESITSKLGINTTTTTNNTNTISNPPILSDNIDEFLKEKEKEHELSIKLLIEKHEEEKKKWQIEREKFIKEKVEREESFVQERAKILEIGKQNIISSSIQSTQNSSSITVNPPTSSSPYTLSSNNNNSNSTSSTSSSTTVSSTAAQYADIRTRDDIIRDHRATLNNLMTELWDREQKIKQLETKLIDKDNDIEQIKLSAQEHEKQSIFATEHQYHCTIAQYVETIKKLETDAESAKLLQIQIQDKYDQLCEQSKQHNSEHGCELSLKNTQIVELTKTIISLTHHKDELQQQLLTLQEQFNSITSTHDHILEQNEQYKQQLTNDEKEISSLQSRIVDILSQIDELNIKLQKEIEHNHSYQTQIQQLQQQIIELQTKEQIQSIQHSEEEGLKSTIKQLNHHIFTLNEQIQSNNHKLIQNEQTITEQKSIQQKLQQEIERIKLHYKKYKHKYNIQHNDKSLVTQLQQELLILSKEFEQQQTIIERLQRTRALDNEQFQLKLSEMTEKLTKAQLNLYKANKQKIPQDNHNDNKSSFAHNIPISSTTPINQSQPSLILPINSFTSTSSIPQPTPNSSIPPYSSSTTASSQQQTVYHYSHSFPNNKENQYQQNQFNSNNATMNSTINFSTLGQNNTNKSNTFTTLSPPRKQEYNPNQYNY